jgi:hypothetical protein
MAAVVVALMINVQPILDQQLTTPAGNAQFAKKGQFYVDECKALQNRITVLYGEMQRENPDTMPNLVFGSPGYQEQAEKAMRIYGQFQQIQTQMMEAAAMVAAVGDVLNNPQGAINLAEDYRRDPDRIPPEQREFLKRVETICERSI